MEGALELFLSNSKVSAAAANTDLAYEGVMHHRLVVLRPDYLLVADILNSSDNAEHIFDWMYHNLGESITSAQATTETEPEDGQGFEYVEDCRRGKSEGTVVADIVNGEHTVRVIMAADGQSEVMIGTGPGESIMHRVPTLFVTRRGTSARFAATVDPTPAGSLPSVVSVEAEADGEGLVVTVQLLDETVEVFGYDPAGRKRTVRGVSTSARLVCLRQEANGWAVIGESESR